MMSISFDHVDYNPRKMITKCCESHAAKYHANIRFILMVNIRPSGSGDSQAFRAFLTSFQDPCTSDPYISHI